MPSSATLGAPAAASPSAVEPSDLSGDSPTGETLAVWRECGSARILLHDKQKAILQSTGAWLDDSILLAVCSVLDKMLPGTFQWGDTLLPKQHSSEVWR